MRDRFNEEFVIFAPYEIKDSVYISDSGSLEVNQIEFETFSGYKEFVIWDDDGPLCTVADEQELLEGVRRYNELMDGFALAADLDKSLYKTLQTQALKQAYPNAPEFQAGVIVEDETISRWSEMDIAYMLEEMHKEGSIAASLQDFTQEQWDILVGRTDSAFGKVDCYYEAGWEIIEQSIKSFIEEKGIGKTNDGGVKAVERLGNRAEQASANAEEQSRTYVKSDKRGEGR